MFPKAQIQVLPRNRVHKQDASRFALSEALGPQIQVSDQLEENGWSWTLNESPTYFNCKGLPRIDGIKYWRKGNTKNTTPRLRHHTDSFHCP